MRMLLCKIRCFSIALGRRPMGRADVASQNAGLLFLFFILCLSPAYAESSQLHTLDALIKETMASNPEILSAKNAFESASARIPRAASLEDPMIGLEYDRITADRMVTGDPMTTFSVTQDIPFPTKLYLRAKIASKLARMAYENYKAKERDVIARVKNAYFELALIDQEIEINEESQRVLGQISQSATERYGAGQGSQSDAITAQVESARIDMDFVLLTQKRLTSQARLNVLINRDPRADLEVSSEDPVAALKPTLEDCYVLARENNPELKSYKYAIERGQAAYALSVNEFLPDLSVEFRQMVKKGEAEDGSWAGMIGVTIPLWFFQKQSFGVKEMASDLEMVKAEYQGKENSVLFEVSDGHARVVANQQLVDLYETIFIPQAEEAVRVTMKRYESEQSNFSDVLDSQRMLIDFKRERYKALLELRIALADLERAVGKDLDF